MKKLSNLVVTEYFKSSTENEKNVLFKEKLIWLIKLQFEKEQTKQ